MLGKLKELTMNLDRSQNVTITLQVDYRDEFDKLKDEIVDIEIKKASKHRSMDANAYFWHLCGEIAKASSKYSTDGKNEVYREAIKAKGEYEPLTIREDAVPVFISRWAQKGTGWFAEVVDDAPGPDAEYYSLMGDSVDSYKIVHAYYGSSTYSSASMSRLIDYVVMLANDVGIPTMTSKEQNKLISAWAKKVGEDG